MSIEWRYEIQKISGTTEIWDTTIEALKEAIRIKPDCIEAHYLLGSAYVKKGNKDDALKEYEILNDSGKILAGKLLKLINKEPKPQ